MLECYGEEIRSNVWKGSPSWSIESRETIERVTPMIQHKPSGQVVRIVAYKRVPHGPEWGDRQQRQGDKQPAELWDGDRPELDQTVTLKRLTGVCYQFSFRHLRRFVQSQPCVAASKLERKQNSTCHDLVTSPWGQHMHIVLCIAEPLPVRGPGTGRCLFRHDSLYSCSRKCIVDFFLNARI